MASGTISGRVAERALARVDVGAIERNCRRLLAGLASGTELCAVVKANGYGHGAAESAHSALRGGATWIAVAAAREAADLRAADVSCPLLVQGALTGPELDVALAAGADVVAWSDDFLTRVAARTGDGRPGRVHVKLDSGMGRLGTREPAEASALVERTVAAHELELVGAMTHFATADEVDPAYLREQLARFESWASRVRSDHPQVLLHAANSAATLREPAAHFDLVRCGIAIYGLDPFGVDPHAQELEPALSLGSYVATVKRFEAGESVGYGRSWRAPRDTWVGVVPVGYGDGWRRGLSNRADVLVGGARHPSVGTVSMDNLTIDLGPETQVRPGDPAVLIGAQGGERILCEEVAERLDTITYEVTCGISARVPRAYVDS